MPTFKRQQLLISGGLILAAVAVLFVTLQFYKSLNRYQIQTFLIRADEAQQAGNYQEAADIRMTIEKIDPNHAQNTLAFAELFYATRNWSHAQEKLIKYRSLRPDDALAHLLLGKTYLKLGNLSEAQKSIDTAHKLQSDNAEIQFYQGLLLIKDKNYEHANELFASATRGNNKVEGMTTFMEQWQATQEETENEVYRDTLITYALLEINQPYLALERIEPVTKTEPEYRDGWYLLGVSYYQAEQYEKAKPAIEKALEIDPNHEASKELKEMLDKS